MKRLLVAAGAGSDEAAVRSRAAALGRALGAQVSVALPATDAERWQLIRESDCPVLIAAGAGSAAPWREILVAVDPMHAHDRPAALDDALIAGARALGALAAPAAARIRLLHCHLPAEYVPLRAPGAIRPGDLRHDERSIDGHRAALQRLAGRHGIPPGDALLEPADPREAIPEAAARLGADLVVMGAVARGRLQRLLIGATAEAVLGRLACDVLAINPAHSAG